jgi:nicotinamidase-related amidase
MTEVKAVTAGDVIVDPNRTALLIIDMQNDFVLPEAQLSTPSAMDLIPTIAGFADACRARGFPVIYTREMHRPGLEDFGVEGCFEPPHCLEGTDGPDIDLLLRGLRVENIIFAGVCTDICVISTVLSARNRDYRCYVLSDAVDATCPPRQAAALMCMSHMFARVGDTAEASACFGLGRNASRPEVRRAGSDGSAESGRRFAVARS